MSAKIQQLAQQVGELLLAQGAYIATAESCTGGLLAQWLTSVSGSSGWFDRGFIPYSMQAKCDMLSVSEQTLATFGAVSEQTAREMAAGVLRYSRASVSVAITGIAGPTGGSVQKPVGLVWFGFGQKNRLPVVTLMQQFAGDRQTIRAAAAEFCLAYLCTTLLQPTLD